MKRHLAVVVILLCVLSIAETGAAPGYLDDGPLLITGVQLIDGLGNPPQKNSDILVENGKITRIAAGGSLVAPEGSSRIDGKGLTAMPGLIDMHIHLKGGWTGGNAMTEKYSAGRSDPELQQTLSAFLYAGVTTVLDVGNPTAWIARQRDRINAGELLGPRFRATGMPFSQTPSGWDGAAEAEGATAPSAFSTKVDTEDPERLRELLHSYVDHDIKLIKLYSGISALGATFLLREAEKLGIRAVADLWQLNMDVDWMKMTGLHGWAHSTPFDVPSSANAWMAANDRFVIATANVGEKLSGLRVKEDKEQSFFDNPLVVDIWGEEVVKDFYASYAQVREELYEGPEAFYQVYNFGDLSGFRDAFLANIKSAWDTGVLVACGTDAPAYPSLWSGETMHRELELFVMAGLSPIDAIKACTYNGARILQEETEYGSLQEGLSADILIVEGNPAVDIADSRNVRHVILRGKSLDLNSLKLQ